LWHENASFAVTEALAAGRPVIAARAGALPELVQHGENGLLFEPGDAADLAAQLRRLLVEPDLLAVLARGARPRRAFDDEMAEVVEIYRRIAAAH
jgi:glycosyltransferase involved in cell wall biosynthesis